jgi:hypothetical protein
LSIPRTDAGFEDAIRAFALTIMTNEAHDNLLHYLKLAVKPACSMDVKAMMNCVLVINLYSTQLNQYNRRLFFSDDANCMAE